MRIGVTIASFTWPGGAAEIARRLAEIGRTAEDAGFYSVWVMDHFFQIEFIGQVDEPMLEGYSAVAYLAGVTRRVKLGTLVTGVVYRHPGILIKTATTLDVLSGGRSYFGIGAAWNEREAHGLGVPFPPIRKRFEQLEDVLQLARQMWADNPAPFSGKHYQLPEPLARPQPVSRPHPPILVGGGGEKKTLRLVAQYADACNVFAMAGPEDVRHKLDVLRRHCDAVGRDYAEIEKTALHRVHLGETTPQQVIDQCRALSKVGVQHVIFYISKLYELAPLEVFGSEIIPAVADL
jgi:F420-dependent oxidoreductase-like protein